MSTRAPRRTNVQSRRAAGGQPCTIHILDGAEAMPFVTLDNLPIVVRALALSGALIVVEYDETWQRLAFYRQGKWIPRRPIENVLEEEDDDDEHESEGLDSGADGEPASSAEALAEPDGESPRSAGKYEEETSEGRSHGSVSIARGAGWVGTLSVPTTDGSGIVFVKFERYGALPVGYDSATEGDFSVPDTEIDAVLLLLQSLVAQARRDGVLAPLP